MPKKQKTKDNFIQDVMKDVLGITATQDEKIKGLQESFTLFSEEMSKQMNEVIKTVQGISRNIVESEQPKVENPFICAVLATPTTPVPEGELLKKVGDIARLIKPVMLKHDMAKIVVTMMSKK